MTWLSRLLTQKQGLQRRTTGERARQGMGRRRQMALESLEDRRLLSNVSVTYTPGPNTLAIVGDTFNDAIRVTENSIAAGGGVTVAPLTASTVVNGTPVPFVTTGPVSQITITLPGTFNMDKVQLIGPGKTVATTVHNVSITDTASPQGANLGLSVNGVDNSGSLTVTVNGILEGLGTISNPTSIGGAATVDNSTFASLNITQTTPCPANVELGNDTIPGSVAVSEDGNNSDIILLQNGDVFGSTVLSQTTGSSDSITVNNARARDLTITQGSGNSDVISVNTLALTNPFGPGVVTTQGNGNTDVTTINAVTIFGAFPPNLPPGFNGQLAGISVTQGNGNNDRATVSNSIVPGNITITQGNGNFDLAQIFGSHAGFATTYDGINYVEIGGNVTITQGNGYNDTATLDSGDVFNNVSIMQGNSVPDGAVPSGFQGPFLGDVININNSTIVSNLTTVQGTAAAAGNYVVNIGTTSAVTATTTSISQHGGNNTVTLGGASAPGAATDFFTYFLDIVTSFVGDAVVGGAFVTAQNTVVLIGSFLGNPYVIDGAGSGNVFVDMGGNSGVVASGNYFSY